MLFRRVLPLLARASRRGPAASAAPSAAAAVAVSRAARTIGPAHRRAHVLAGAPTRAAPGPNHPTVSVRARSVASQPQTPAMTTAPTTHTIADLVKADHAKVSHLFDCVKKANAETEKQVCMWKIIRELSIHAALEEEVLYPVLKAKFGAEGMKWADKSVNEHHELKKVLYELDQIDADPKNVKTMTLLGNIEKLNNAHIKEEEEQLFPWMAKNCTAGGVCMTELGKQYLSYKPYMPTRPHPDAPSGSYIGDRALAIADYVRDAKRFAGVKDYNVGESPDKLPAVHTAKPVTAHKA